VVELASGRTLLHHGMTGEVAALVRTAFLDHGLTSFVFDADGIHHEHAGAPYAAYIRTWSPNLRVVEDAAHWQTEPLAALAVGDEAAVAAAHAVLRDHAAQLFSVKLRDRRAIELHRARPRRAGRAGRRRRRIASRVSGKSALLVRAAGANKGTALAELCRHAGCSLAEAVAVGDWINDVPMFEVAGRSFRDGERARRRARQGHRRSGRHGRQRRGHRRGESGVRGLSPPAPPILDL